MQLLEAIAIGTMFALGVYQILQRNVIRMALGLVIISWKPCSARMARYSGNERPAWRMNHTGVRSVRRRRQACRNGASASVGRVT